MTTKRKSTLDQFLSVADGKRKKSSSAAVKTLEKDSNGPEQKPVKTEGSAHSSSTSTGSIITQDGCDKMRKTIKEEIIKLCEKRGLQKTCCPSEVARKVSPGGWRDLMEPVRCVARQLAQDGKINICQKGQIIDHTKDWTGPIRLRITQN